MTIKQTLIQQATRQFAGGLVDTKPDGTEYSLEQFGGRRIGKAPTKEFEIPNIPKVRDQKNSDFCVSFQDAYTVEQDYGKLFSPAFNFAATKKRYYKNYFGFGLAIKHGLSSLQKDGICQDSYFPFGKSSRNRMANWKNISQEAWDNAKKYKMNRGYFFVDIYPNKFDNFLAGMYHWQEMVITGMKWYSGYKVDDKGRLIMNKTGPVFGHAFGSIRSIIVEGEQRIEFINSYLNLPTFSLNRQQCNSLYYGYIVPPIERPIVEIIKKYAGKIVRAKSNKPPMYIIIDGKKRHFTSENMLNLYGRSLKQYIEVPDDELNSIPSGDPITREDLEIWARELIERKQIKL